LLKGDKRIKGLCKLDLEKAYNCMHWNFLIYMLRRCRFSQWR